MTATLRQEQVIDDAIRASLIGTADEVVDVGIEAIRRRLHSSTGRIRQQQIEAAADRLRKFGEKYHFSLGGLTIKELVNEGRR